MRRLPSYTIRVYRNRDDFAVVARHRTLTHTEKKRVKLLGWGAYIYDDKIPALGMVIADRTIYGGKPAMAAGSQVQPQYRRRGLATKLYAKAAQIARIYYKAPLASDTRRSVAADAYWKKQVRFGKARPLRLRPEEYNHGNLVYVMRTDTRVSASRSKARKGRYAL